MRQLLLMWLLILMLLRQCFKNPSNTHNQGEIFVCIHFKLYLFCLVFLLTNGTQSEVKIKRKQQKEFFSNSSRIQCAKWADDKIESQSIIIMFLSCWPWVNFLYHLLSQLSVLSPTGFATKFKENFANSSARQLEFHCLDQIKLALNWKLTSWFLIKRTWN